MPIRRSSSSADVTPPSPGADATPDADVRLRVLGTVDLTGAPGANRIHAQPKRLALLVYLAAALPRAFHRRDTLLAMFWPELDQSRARAALRQSLHFLRRSLPSDLLVTRGADEVGIARDRFRVDAAEFDALLDDGREAAALELYGGELLPGFHVDGCPDFGRWLDLERDRLNRSAVRATLVLARRAAAESDGADVARYARAAVELGPGDVATLREAVAVLLEAADGATALALGEQWIARAENAPPAARDLVEQLRRGAFPPRPDEPDRRASAAGRPALAIVSRSGAAVNDPPAGQVDRRAYQAYLRGLHADAERTPGAIDRAIAHYRRAVALAPDFALGHAGLARALVIGTVYSGHPPSEMYPLVKHHAAKALALDARLAAAYNAMAESVLCYEWDWHGAERLWLDGLGVDPGSSELRIGYALYLLTPSGRFDEAIEQIELARELDPTSLAVHAYVAMVRYHARQFERAREEAEATLELSEQFALAWWILGMAHEGLERHQDAVSAYERSAELTGGSSIMLAQLARGHAAAGNRRQALTMLDELAKRTGERRPPPYFVATVRLALGAVDLAMEALYEAYRERAPHLVFTGVFPILDALRDEPAFRRLLLRIGLFPTPADRDS